MCISTGIKCHTTTTSTTTTTTTPSTTKLTTLSSTTPKKLFKGRNRLIPSKNKPRLRRPPSSLKNNYKINLNEGNYSPGYRPKHPPSIEQLTKITPIATTIATVFNLNFFIIKLLL